MSLYEALKEKLAWLQFDSGLRTEMYQAIATLLRGQVQLNDAMRKLIFIYSEGKASSQHPIVLALRDGLHQVEEGASFSESLKGWLPPEEAEMLASGESSGKLLWSFSEVIVLIQAKQRMKSAIYGALVYPCVLFALAGVLLYVVAYQVVPELGVVIPPDQWTGAASVLYLLSSFVTQYGWITLSSLLSVLTVILVTLPQAKVPFRVYLDRLPPWSIYRMLQGSTFLLNISALIASGAQLDLALKGMSERASSWLQVRLDATRRELAAGKSFGEALVATGYGFPDTQINYFLAVISEYGGAEKAMSEVGKRWLDESIKQIERITNLLSVAGICVVGAVMILVVVGASGLQDLLQQAYTP